MSAPYQPKRRYSAMDVAKLCASIAEDMGLEDNLVLAIASVESSYNYLATRIEPKWSAFLTPSAWAARNQITELTEKAWQAQSLGPMQVMGAVCRELGHQGLLAEVVEQPELGITYGCKKLLRLQKQYENESAVIAAYNAGTPRKIVNIQTKVSEYVNQPYVNKVQASLMRLRSIEGGDEKWRK